MMTTVDTPQSKGLHGVLFPSRNYVTVAIGMSHLIILYLPFDDHRPMFSPGFAQDYNLNHHLTFRVSSAGLLLIAIDWYVIVLLLRSLAKLPVPPS